jgi:hypothetical protein
MTENPNILYCANHPGVPTTLRCNRCEKPICIKCAVLTPTGYRCRECVRGQQKVYETAQWRDFPLACGLAFIIAFFGSFLAQVMFGYRAHLVWSLHIPDGFDCLLPAGRD